MPRQSSWKALVLPVLSSVIVGLVTNVASGVLPGWYEPYKWTAWLLVPVSVGGWVIVEWRLVRRTSAERSPTRVKALLIKEQQRWWITEVLDKSLHHEARVGLEVRMTVDEEHPWKLRIEGRDELTRRGITEIFDTDMSGWMVILGAPGSGKTTMLLELLRDLLERAETSSPVPLLLNLASWEGDLATWAELEAARRYRAPGPIRDWLISGEMTLLLDGLDEVPLGQRSACMAAINQFLAANPSTAVVVSCRTEEYAALSGGLAMRGRVEIQPLTAQEVDAYLQRHGLEHARSILAEDPELRGLVTCPLLLAVLTLAYRNAPERVPDGYGLSRLFDTYLDQMLARRTHPWYSSDQLLVQLRFLARRSMEDGQTMLNIDGLYAVMPYRNERFMRIIQTIATAFVLCAAGAAWHGLLGGAAGLATTLVVMAEERTTAPLQRTRAARPTA